MIDLRNKKVVVRSKEECDDLLEYAREQGFRWANDDELYSEKVLCEYPCSIKLHSDRTVSYNGLEKSTFNLFSWNEIRNNCIGLSAGEFIDFIINVKENCAKAFCAKCVFDDRNTKCKENLCVMLNWKNNKEELMNIAKRSKTKVEMNNKEAAEVIQNYIDRKDRMPLPDDFIACLKLAVKKLEEE